MPLTLAEAKVGYADKVDQQVIDEFRRDSVLLDKLTFDDTISPTGGSNLVYGYQRLETPSTAGVRQINSEYTANEAKRTKQTASPVILGGSFEIDRVIAQTSGAINEMDFQIKQKTKAGAETDRNTADNARQYYEGKHKKYEEILDVADCICLISALFFIIPVIIILTTTYFKTETSKSLTFSTYLLVSDRLPAGYQAAHIHRTSQRKSEDPPRPDPVGGRGCAGLCGGPV